MTVVVPFPTKLAFAIAPFIFLPLWHYVRYVHGTMTLTEQSVLVHEQVHIDRERAHGLIDYGVQYCYDATFRLKEELIAIDVQMKFLKAHGGTYDIERKAQQFASATYGYVMSENDAARALRKLWETGILES